MSHTIIRTDILHPDLKASKLPRPLHTIHDTTATRHRHIHVIVGVGANVAENVRAERHEIQVHAPANDTHDDETACEQDNQPNSLAPVDWHGEIWAQFLNLCREVRVVGKGRRKGLRRSVDEIRGAVARIPYSIQDCSIGGQFSGFAMEDKDNKRYPVSEGEKLTGIFLQSLRAGPVLDLQTWNPSW